MAGGLNNDATRRIQTLADDIRKASSHSIKKYDDARFVVRVEREDGGRRICVLDGEEHAQLARLLAIGPGTLETSLGVLEWWDLASAYRGSIDGISILVKGSKAISSELKRKLEAALTDALTAGKQALARSAIGKGLYTLYRGRWLPDDSEPVGRAEFESRPRLRGVSVTIEAPSEVTLEWDDTDLFAGHSIFVVIDRGKVLDGSLEA